MKRRMPTLNALKVFEVAAAQGSFTRAAHVLHVTQGAVSRQVRQLEDQLGEVLLARRHHRLELTAAGRTLLRGLRRAFDGIELTVRAVQQQQDRSRLHINAPPTFALRWLLPRLGRLRAAHPELEISLTSQTRDNLVEMGQLDCAIRFGDGEWNHLESSLIFHERHMAVCSPGLLANRRPEEVELSEHALIHVLAAPDRRYMTWQHWLQAAGLKHVEVQGGYEFDLLDMAIRAAADGLGITIADRHMVSPELADGTLVPFRDVEIEGHQSYWLVTRAGQPPSPVVDHFRAWMQNEAERS
ncbi:LysR substrate-binding domain-containing protein [Dyella sp. ASV21]|uniref:LysR substrate-binding domain-containing protein n=1 Tax=Dyella sp. ASV21 TaxID=2795114 RepID=UPI0018ECB0A0|nr:LysR substrate-binding domain-containing protein [Dyella sp. ASV21]